MTANQIAYVRYLEEQRSNRAKETETYRHNLATEGLSQRELAEANRHNVAVEQYNLSYLAESARHNQAGEAETYRHNVQQEQYNLGSLAEAIRSNQARETEIFRANTASEAIAASRAREEKRANRTKEAETKRHNQAVEEEAKRSNLVNEAIQQQNANSLTANAATGGFSNIMNGISSKAWNDFKNWINPYYVGGTEAMFVLPVYSGGVQSYRNDRRTGERLYN